MPARTLLAKLSLCGCTDRYNNGCELSNLPLSLCPITFSEDYPQEDRPCLHGCNFSAEVSVSFGMTLCREAGPATPDKSTLLDDLHLVAFPTTRNNVHKGKH